MLFSGESQFAPLHSESCARVYRGPIARFVDCCIQLHDRFGGRSGMDWSRIIPCKRTKCIVYVDGMLYALRYKDTIFFVQKLSISCIRMVWLYVLAR